MKTTLSQATLNFLQQPLGSFINGKVITTKTQESLEIFNPATGLAIASVPICSKQDLEEAVQCAHESFIDGRWANMRPAERERVLYKLSELLIEHQETLAQLETLNQGKCIRMARAIEVGSTAEYIRYIAGWCTKITGDTFDISIPSSSTDFTSYTKRSPIGVVGAIAPWNFPLSIAAWKSVPALAAGCSVVLKPAQETPLTALFLAKLAIEAGVPKGVFNVLVGADGDIGQQLVEHPTIRKVTFTGSTAVGKKVGKAAVEHMAHFSLELGGKNPMIIMDDIPIKQAVDGIMIGAFLNSGQVCAAASRIYLHENIYEEVKTELSKVIKNLVVGDGLDEKTQISPVVSAKQQASIKAHIAKAKAEGATILSGAIPEDSTGFYIPPTIITDIKPSARILVDEVFGPVVALIPFKETQEVIKLANETEYGLAASIWTHNLNEAMQIVPKIEAGTVWVNAHVLIDPAMPFGGVKQSGIGREFGKTAVESFTELKSVCIAYPKLPQ
ncbi:aldehyde dehydrogenase family protein [Ignatzschineria rhizosphaerae]|uniref:Aldehyde dehydrogenase family protein n=1 Tax=Ignatzschineria rhizosphaerae TaxID=2923279 RepID=A0ABY3X3K6_9GAMM|nr:aldehyde dehydrogenase family protein [Ignatzschineria rhizosphaerae]UNM97463.1 aldehyde dehydrogenase family protein [Ignatzschineria rhizosphaerae]